MKASYKQTIITTALIVALATSAIAQAESEEELAKATQNPIAALISVPLQYNYDQNIGPQRTGTKNYINVQPVIPILISEEWNMISRTIVPLVTQSDIAAGSGTQSGVGDVTQSLFFSPKKPTDSGLIWGVGPVFLLPTASNDLLGGEKWGLGPTAVLLKQESGWTYGMLANHIWSVAGTSSRPAISSTFLQPFLSFTTKSYTTYGVNTESTYSWKTNNSTPWSVPINLSVTQLLKVGNQRFTLQAGARYWADSPDAGAHGWGARFAVTFLFPK